MSLAFFDNGCRSREIRSIAASMAELINSTMRAYRHTAMSNARSTRMTLRKNVNGISTTLSNTN